MRGRKKKLIFADKSKGDTVSKSESKPESNEQSNNQNDEAGKKRVRYGDIIYKCVECGGDLKKLHNWQSPEFLIRNFVCMKCGRETDQYVTERKIVEL